MISGSYNVGDRVVILPSQKKSRIRSLQQNGIEVMTVHAPQPAVILLEEEIDISRGDLICVEGSAPELSQSFKTLICWMDEKPLMVGNRYTLQVGSRRVKAKISQIEYKIDVNTMSKTQNIEKAELNDIVGVHFTTNSELALDSFQELKANGQGIFNRRKHPFPQ